LPSETKVVNA